MTKQALILFSTVLVVMEMFIPDQSILASCHFFLCLPYFPYFHCNQQVRIRIPQDFPCVPWSCKKIRHIHNSCLNFSLSIPFSYICSVTFGNTLSTRPVFFCYALLSMVQVLQVYRQYKVFLPTFTDKQISYYQCLNTCDLFFVKGYYQNRNTSNSLRTISLILQVCFPFLFSFLLSFFLFSILVFSTSFYKVLVTSVSDHLKKFQ